MFEKIIGNDSIKEQLVKSLNKENLGIIIRTEAVGCDIDKLKEDFVEEVDLNE